MNLRFKSLARYFMNPCTSARSTTSSFRASWLSESFLLKKCYLSSTGRVQSFGSGTSSTTWKSTESATNSTTEQINNEHFKLSRIPHPLGDRGPKRMPASYWENPIPHPIYTKEDWSAVQKTHHEPEKIRDTMAMTAVKSVRSIFDYVSGYKGPGGEMTKLNWLHRCIFLETLAGVPGMVAGMCRHLKSLRTMQRDHGWIHTLLEEAENERMHLLIFMNMKSPGFFFRFLVLGGQGVFFNSFFITYLVSPKMCHRFVGYLEEEAVKTYTGLLEDMGPKGHLESWGDEPAPSIARQYYKLSNDAKVRDIIQCIRADEANHRDVNHTFADLDQRMDNPFLQKHTPGQHQQPPPKK